MIHAALWIASFLFITVLVLVALAASWYLLQATVTAVLDRGFRAASHTIRSAADIGVSVSNLAGAFVSLPVLLAMAIKSFRLAKVGPERFVDPVEPAAEPVQQRRPIPAEEAGVTITVIEITTDPPVYKK
jgi:hypothetical protein